MVELKREPITAEGKNILVKRELRLVFDRFAEQSLNRSWVAQHLPYRREMAELGPLLQADETGWMTNLLLGDMAVEFSEPHYVQDGIQASGNDYVSRTFYENYWGPQERRHHEALRIALIDSGLQTPDQVFRYLLECEESEPWTFERQTGYGGYDLLWGIAYASAQEAQTRLTYHSTRKIAWEMYGSPRDANGRKELQTGVCGVLTKIAEDEGAHQGFFLQEMLVYLRYWPDKALEALMGVFHGYKMPVVHIPNADEFLHAVIRAKLLHPKWVLTEVHNPVAKRLGLESRSAIRKALHNFGKLLDGGNAVVQLPGKELKADDIPQGATIYEMKPNGEFVNLSVVAI